MIDHDEEIGAESVVRTGPGWRQETPPGNGRRKYYDTAPGDDRWDATDEAFDSLTSALGVGYPTDWSQPAKWNQARWTWENRTDLLTKPEAEAVRAMVDSSTITLNQAADRGSAIHRYIEARLEGHVPDWEDCRRRDALPWIAAVEAFLDDVQVQPMLIEAVAFHRDLGIAGTTDSVSKTSEGVGCWDWKTRAKGHDRRGKEAAQLGGYRRMLTEGYYFDDRGLRRQLEQLDYLAIVTFCGDGTYAIHYADLDAADRAFNLAMEMGEASKVSRLYPARPVKGPAA